MNKIAVSDVMESQEKWKKHFFDKLTRIDLLFEVFDQLPDVSLFIKDTEGRYVHINQMMSETLGVSDHRSILGKTDFDLFPPALAKNIVAQDQAVLRLGQPLWNQKSLMPGSEGLPSWYRFNKLPLYDNFHQVIGIVGIKLSKTSENQTGDGNAQLKKVVKFVSEKFGEPISVSDMAAAAEVSVSQLQRIFRRDLQTNPLRYLQEVRIGHARELLKNSRLNMAAIANQCGFYDQSHFSRFFKKSTGLSPVAFRTKFS